MTQQEITNYRPPKFSGWIRSNLPDSFTGLLVTDIDFVLFNNKTQKVMLIELKTNNTPIKTWQRELFKCLNRWITNGVDEGWQYLGFHLIEFSGTDFTDGNCTYDYVTVTEDELIKKLSI
jgi:hypothetical protein